MTLFDWLELHPAMPWALMFWSWMISVSVAAILTGGKGSG